MKLLQRGGLMTKVASSDSIGCFAPSSACAGNFEPAIRKMPPVERKSKMLSKFHERNYVFTRR